MEGRKDLQLASDLSWRRERPTQRDFNVWKIFLSRLAPCKKLVPPVGRWVAHPHHHSKWLYDEEREEVMFTNSENVLTLFKLESNGEESMKEKRFRFSAQIRGTCNSKLEVQVHWNGLNPSLIGIHLYEVETTLVEKELQVENDRYVRVKHMDYRTEFIQAARKDNLKAVADASFNREFSTEVAAAAWVMETKDGQFQWEGSGLMKAEKNLSY